MNPPDVPSLFFSLALLIAIARSNRKLRTFVYAVAVENSVAIATILLAFFFHPENGVLSLAHLAGDFGRLAGIITAFLYSTKTRERVPRSIYVISLSGAIVLLAGLALALY